jgi:isopropylmalate/homocitrate/citramalate synthase
VRHPARVTVVEVGPRDGLQNEATLVGTADKVRFIDLLSAAGLPVVEVSSFVSPRWVPALADAADVFASLEKRPATRYSALIPNVTGLERAVAAGASEVAIFTAVSETFSARNTGRSIDESLAEYTPVCARAAAAGMRVRAYLSTAFGCPYEGEVPVARVARLSAALVAMGAFEVAVSDTIGVAHPGQVLAVVDAVAAVVPLERIALHFHDTRGTALANVLAALGMGVTTFDSSAGGLGGCPYAPGAAGNLATEELIYMLDGLGIQTGVNLAQVVAASRFIESRIGRPLPSRYAQAARASHHASPPSSRPAGRRSSS